MFWFVVHTKPRQELRALQNLRQQGYCCYLPQMQAERLQGGRVVSASEPLFPRYLFVQLDSSASGKSWAPIRSTLGVSRLVCFGETPAQLSDALVESLQSREQERATQPLFSAGDKVDVASGPFAGLDAVFQNPDGDARAMVLIEMLSKPVLVRVPAAALRRIV